jgi:hypothetical protein
MTDTPKFEVIDRRKRKAEEEQQTPKAVVPEAPAAPSMPAEAAPVTPASGPRLVVNQGVSDSGRDAAAQEPAAAMGDEDLATQEVELPPAPTAQESSEQEAAYDAAAERLEDLVRAQNPGVGKQPPVGFEHLVQQFYVSAMIQMGAGTQEGQRPRVDILGARGTIDMLGVLAEKTRGNLTETEDRVLQSVLYEVRMAFLELTSMISLQGVQPPPVPPPAGKR